MNANTSAREASHAQFSLRGLLEFMAIMGLISAVAHLTGVAAAAALMLFMAAIALRQGGLAVLALAAACGTADSQHPQFTTTGPILPQAAVIAVATLGCLWKLRRETPPMDPTAT